MPKPTSNEQAARSLVRSMREAVSLGSFALEGVLAAAPEEDRQAVGRIITAASAAREQRRREQDAEDALRTVKLDQTEAPRPARTTRAPWL